MPRSIIAGLAVLALAGAAPALAQDHQHMPGMQRTPGMEMPGSADSLPKEGGQSAFAAIGEIANKLQADPKTDWSKVDLDVLRDHLVDMDNVALRAHVATTPVPGGARFEVTGDTDTIRNSIRTMIRMHTAMADGENGRHVVQAPTDQGAVLTVTGKTDLDQTKIRALGFFGLLTGGVHHQLHHWMMAKGEMMHH